ncbi:NAD(P)H-quinone oxidoreductase [Pseudomonas sp. F1_0610]|uniref:NAD(P)H-quinone oxidoreductase n=1 Tax=Pseudomonas sp. F1_0610 TaxID=3114284 RepID=UPI0039C3FD60
MKALQGIDGQPSFVDVKAPDCAQGQVRIKVMAVGLNRADLLQVKGLYPPPKGVSDVLGLECAGVITETGEDSRWKIGNKVCALLAGEGMAEEVVVDERHVLPIPEGLSFEQAAVLPEVYSTAWLNLFQLGDLKPGEKALLYAGASGVGSAAIQLCKAFNSPCWVTVGSPERLQHCQALGAEGGVVRHQGIEALQDFAPFDVVLDPVGASYAEQTLKMLKQDGRWVNIGLMGGRKFELDMALILGKRIQLIGSTLRARDADFKAQLIQDLETYVWPLFAASELDPCLEEVFDWAEAKAAFEKLGSNTVSGKLALSIN